MTHKPLTLADVHPDRFYSARDTAAVLTLSVDAIYRMGNTPRLPKTRLGPNGGKTAFRGKVILAYAERAS